MLPGVKSCFVLQLVISHWQICMGLRLLHYRAYPCDNGLIPDFEAFKPMRSVENVSVTSRLECVTLYSGDSSRKVPLMALVYFVKSHNMTSSWYCNLLTVSTSSAFNVYEMTSDLKDAGLTPFCGLYFRQDQTCDTLQGQGQIISWINLWPEHPGVIALCDFDTDGGGWTVIQRRQDGSEDFCRGWEDYKVGFGSLSGEFWFGLEKIRTLVDSKPHEIRFDMETIFGVKRYAVYKDFWFSDESQNYRMTVGSYSGNAGDSFSFHDGAEFDTKDKLPRPLTLCPERFRSGFWFHNCHNINPNGIYGSSDWGVGINWNTVTGYYQSLTYIEIKIRPMM